MIEQTTKFFNALLGEGFDVNILYAISACIAFLLIYGIILRPLLSLANGKKGRPIFDIVVVGLILMIGFKLLYPGFLVVDGFTQEDVDAAWELGYSEGKDYSGMEYWDEGYAEGYADALKDYDIEVDTPEDSTAPETTETPEDTLPVYASVDEAGAALYPNGYSTDSMFDYDYSFDFYTSEENCLFISEADAIEVYVTGTPSFYVGDVLWYHVVKTFDESGEVYVPSPADGESIRRYDLDPEA